MKFSDLLPIQTPRFSRVVTAVIVFAAAVAFVPKASRAQTHTQVPGNVVVGPKHIHLQRDGSIWTPHGVVMIAFEAAAKALPTSPAYIQNGHAAFVANDPLPGIAAWGADTIRFMISQPGCDPQDPNGLYGQGYVNNIVSAVLEARSLGLNVIVNLQDESPSGDPTDSPYPDAATNRAWQKLAPYFNSDQGILYEIYNEPAPDANTANWGTWAQTMGGVITTIRNTGSTNVILADGLQRANVLDGAPLLADPTGNIAYAVHPYFHSGTQQMSTYWDSTFGTFAETEPVVVTEWYPGTAGSFYCETTTTPQASLNLYSYLQSNGIGITAFAYDFPGNGVLNITGSVDTDYTGTPTTFLGTGCGDDAFGPGTVLQNWYRSGKVPTTLQ